MAAMKNPSLLAGVSDPEKARSKESPGKKLVVAAMHLCQQSKPRGECRQRGGEPFFI
ncbi:MAG: hypothetical protein ACLRI7_13785 [Ruthenibacterium lactatiformans]